MSEVKFFEIRDAMTFMPVMAVRLDPRFEEERYLMSRAGFRPENREKDKPFVLLMPLEKDRFTWDPNEWGSRTLHLAHEHMVDQWEELPTGSVIDVEFILGLRDIPKVSERVEFPV